ncbi:MAG: MFS transporter [Chloroflexi bacterium]|nr:MFS transporter [Chloroflexota bacterium]
MRVKLFYGWYMVLAGMLITTYNSAIFAYGWTAFLNPIVMTFGWSMTQLSLAASLRGIETGVLNPVFGAMVDRWPARRMMLLGVFTAAAAALLLGLTRNLIMYYIGFLLVGIGMTLTGGLVATTIVARWFRRNIGKANGLLFMGPAIGGMLAPVVVLIIDRLTWQTTLLYVAAGYLALGIPIALIFRSWPAEYGLLPDGKPLDSATVSKRTASYDFSTTTREAVRSRAFWHFVVVTAFQFTCQGTVTLFAIPYLTSVGMERVQGAGIITLYTLVSMFTRMPLGILSDYVRKSYVVALTILMQATGVVLFWRLDASSPFWAVLLFAITFGVGSGGVMVLRAPLLQEYFGSKNFGKIFGLNSIFITGATVVTTPLVGWVWDTQQTYKPVWLAIAIFGAIALLAILTIPSPARRLEAAATTGATERR